MKEQISPKTNRCLYILIKPVVIITKLTFEQEHLFSQKWDQN